MLSLNLISSDLYILYIIRPHPRYINIKSEIYQYSQLEIVLLIKKNKTDTNPKIKNKFHSFIKVGDKN